VLAVRFLAEHAILITEVTVEEQGQTTSLKKPDAGAVWFNHLTPIHSSQEAFTALLDEEADGMPASLTQHKVRTEEALKKDSLMRVENTNKGLIVNSDVLNHANFGLLPVPRKSFGALGASVLINGLICAAVLILTISQVHEAHLRERRLQLTYLAVQPKPYVPPVIKVKMPPIPKTDVAKIVPPKPVLMPEPPKIVPLKVATVAPVIPVAPPRPVIQPPAPVVGMFHNSTPAPATAVKVAAVAKAAGFGDPSGVTPNPNANRAANVATLGGFGSASSTAEGAGSRKGVVQGAGFGTGAGAGSPNGSAHGVVTAVGFGTGTQAASQGRQGSVSTAGFGGGSPAAPAPAARVQQPVTTAIVVLSKPLPQYTSEARDLRIEGDVTLEVRFTATGEVDVLRVVNGLGHGLDEQARLAAQRIRFKPATRDGKPVDQVSVIHVAFQLA
jgi:TonB family protein